MKDVDIPLARLLRLLTRVRFVLPLIVIAGVSVRNAALGDFQTSSGPVENVVGNFWSIGAAVIIR